MGPRKSSLYKKQAFRIRKKFNFFFRFELDTYCQIVYTQFNTFQTSNGENKWRGMNHPFYLLLSRHSFY